MELCSYNHDEICHSERKCPLCEMAKQYDETVSLLESERDRLQEEIVELKSQIPNTNES